MSRPTVAALTLVASIIVLAWAGPTTAGAHDDAGAVTITRAEQVGPTSVLVEVGVVFAGDGHLAEEASVTATLTSGDSTVGPVTLQHGDEGTSLYSATIDVANTGTWDIQVESSEPTGTTEGSVVVSDTVPQMEQAQASTPPPTTSPTTNESSPSDDTAPVDDAAPLVAASPDDGSISPAIVIGACLALAALVIGGAFLVARQRSRQDADPGGEDGEGAAT